MPCSPQVRSGVTAEQSDAGLALATQLAGAGRGEEALAAIDGVLARDTRHADALLLRAGILMQMRRMADADAAFRLLTVEHPGEPRGWIHHGHLLKALGRIDEAAIAYRGAVKVSVRPGAAWWGLANLKPLRLDGADIVEMRTALEAANVDDERIYLRFALGRALDDLGEARDAWMHLEAGNALRLARVPHDAARTSASFRRLEALFTGEFLHARAGVGATARGPIFIVGMPRSGSTLVEQILASHPLVEGTAELHELHLIARQVLSGDDPASLDGFASLSAARLRALGNRYLQMTRRHRGTDRPFFTDKMPSNWIHTGLIRVILPGARIVDVRRHPMACGFANFAQHYHQGNAFAYDLAGIGRFYADYVRHIAHFDRVSPGSVHRVHYEALVDDPEREVRRLLAWLELPFDPACLRPHKTARAVHTPSSGQVRQPINRDGLDRWRAYQPWLGALEAALGPALTHYPDTSPAA